MCALAVSSGQMKCIGSNCTPQQQRHAEFHLGGGEREGRGEEGEEGGEEGEGGGRRGGVGGGGGGGD